MKNLSKMLTFGAAVLFFGCANAIGAREIKLGEMNLERFDEIGADFWELGRGREIGCLAMEESTEGWNFINKLIEKEKALSEEKPSAERLAAEMKALSDEAKALVERWSETERSLGIKRFDEKEIAERNERWEEKSADKATFLDFEDAGQEAFLD